jgi:hypothetical protein
MLRCMLILTLLRSPEKNGATIPTDALKTELLEPAAEDQGLAQGKKQSSNASMNV